MTDAHPRSLLLVSGSTRNGSVNTAILTTAAELLPSTWSAAFSPRVDRLPIFDPDLEASAAPAMVAELRASIARADALLFSTPEYAGAMPGALKNLLEWTIGDTVMSGKPVGWINPSTAPQRAINTYTALRTVLSYTGAALVEGACRDIPVSRSQIGDAGIIEDIEIRDRISSVMLALSESTVH